MTRYNIIIPVYNRPDEADELLESLCRQTFKDFRVTIVEDGSDIPCKEVADKYSDRLNLTYMSKPNSGPGQTRNYGVEKSEASEYVIFLDSDAVVPEGYMAEVDSELAAGECDLFGGPDKAHQDFTPMQKAINYAMTSFFTTGGIRGGKKQLGGRFNPRSFNMGIRRTAFDKVKGFSTMRFGEDIDLCLRLFEAGFSSRLFPKAWVWHKRRTNLRKFFKQVFNSGIARINLTKRHPGSLKVVHLLPAVFTLGCAALVVGAFFCLWSLLPLLAFALLVMVDATFKEKSLKVGLLAVMASYVQLTGYGSGFLWGFVKRVILGQNEFGAFEKTFYK